MPLKHQRHSLFNHRRRRRQSAYCCINPFCHYSFLTNGSAHRLTPFNVTSVRSKVDLRITGLNYVKETFGAPPTLTDASNSVVVRGAGSTTLKRWMSLFRVMHLLSFSGVSGSGKSSLAFGTIYAEAQRRYFESVAPYARRLIDQAGVPDVDAIDGLPPAVALQQQRGTSNARSSVGSVTTLSSLGAHDVFPGREPIRQNNLCSMLRIFLLTRLREHVHPAMVSDISMM